MLFFTCFCASIGKCKASSEQKNDSPGQFLLNQLPIDQRRGLGRRRRFRLKGPKLVMGGQREDDHYHQEGGGRVADGRLVPAVGHSPQVIAPSGDEHRLAEEPEENQDDETD